MVVAVPLDPPRPPVALSRSLPRPLPVAVSPSGLHLCCHHPDHRADHHADHHLDRLADHSSVAFGQDGPPPVALCALHSPDPVRLAALGATAGSPLAAPAAPAASAESAVASAATAAHETSRRRETSSGAAAVAASHLDQTLSAGLLSQLRTPSANSPVFPASRLDLAAAIDRSPPAFAKMPQSEPLLSRMHPASAASVNAKSPQTLLKRSKTFPPRPSHASRASLSAPPTTTATATATATTTASTTAPTSSPAAVSLQAQALWDQRRRLFATDPSTARSMASSCIDHSDTIDDPCINSAPRGSSPQPNIRDHPTAAVVVPAQQHQHYYYHHHQQQQQLQPAAAAEAVAMSLPAQHSWLSSSTANSAAIPIPFPLASWSAHRHHQHPHSSGSASSLPTPHPVFVSTVPIVRPSSTPPALYSPPLSPPSNARMPTRPFDEPASRSTAPSNFAKPSGSDAPEPASLTPVALFRSPDADSALPASATTMSTATISATAPSAASGTATLVDEPTPSPPKPPTLLLPPSDVLADQAAQQPSLVHSPLPLDPPPLDLLEPTPHAKPAPEPILHSILRSSSFDLDAIDAALPDPSLVYSPHLNTNRKQPVQDRLHQHQQHHPQRLSTSPMLSPPLAPVPVRKNSSGRRSIKFADDIEHICLFDKTQSPSVVSDTDVLVVSDNGNLDIGSVSSAFALSDRWIVTEKNTPAHSHFGSLSVVLDHIDINNANVLQISVLARNLAFEKSVVVRYTIDNWATYTDKHASFKAVVTPSLGNYTGVDRFVAKLDLNREFGLTATSHCIEFAIRYCVRGQEHWDNNGRHNYKIVLQRPLMAQVLEEAARKPPVRASLQWNDDFSVRLNSRSRRHSLDSVVVPNASSSALQGSGLISDILSANNTSTSNGSKPTAGPSTSRSTSWPNVSYAASPLQSSQSPYMVTQTAFNSSLGFLEQTNSDQDLFQKVPAQSMLGKRAVSLLKPQTPMFLPQHDPTQSASPVSLRPPASATQAIESRPTLSVWSETQRDLPSSYGGGYSRGYCPSAGVRADSFTSQPFLSGPMPSTPGIEMPLSSSLFGFMDIGPGHPLMRTAPRSTPFPQTSVLGGHGPNSRPPSPLPDPEPLHMA